MLGCDNFGNPFLDDRGLPFVYEIDLRLLRIDPDDPMSKLCETSYSDAADVSQPEDADIGHEKNEGPRLAGWNRSGNKLQKPRLLVRPQMALVHLAPALEHGLGGFRLLPHPENALRQFVDIVLLIHEQIFGPEIVSYTLRRRSHHKPAHGKVLENSGWEINLGE